MKISCAFACMTTVFLPLLALAEYPARTWKLNGNGFEGELIIKSAEDGKVEGTIYGQTIVGIFDEETKRLNFVRLQDPKDPTSFQAWKGYLFQNAAGKEITYTLAGTIQPFGAPGMHQGMMEPGWFAQLRKIRD